MDGDATATAPRRQVELPDRGGAMSMLDLGPAERAVDVVFLHANGFNAQTYRSILAPLATSMRLLAVDMRGHGATTLPTPGQDRRGWNDLRDDLIALLAKLDVAPVVLSGHSMGATTALLAAAEVPQRVRRLVLFELVIRPREATGVRNAGEMPDSPLVQGAMRRRATFPSRTAVLDAYRGRGAFKAWTEDMLADYVAGGFRDLPSGEVTLACEPSWEVSNFVSQRHDSWAAFERSTCPIRILRAEHNSTARIGDRLEALTADGRITCEVVPGTTHFLPMERPDLVRAALSEAVGLPLA